MVKNAENRGYGWKFADFVSATTKSSSFHKVTLTAENLHTTQEMAEQLVKLIDRINVGKEVSEIIESLGIELLSSLEPWYGESAGLDAFQCLEKTTKDPSMADTIVGSYTHATLHDIAENKMVVIPAPPL